MAIVILIFSIKSVPENTCFLVLLVFWGSHYVNVSVAIAFLELYSAINKCIESVVATHAHVQTRTVHRTALTADDVTSLCELTAINFNAKSLAFALATVLRTTYTFFMCHNR